MKTWFFENNVNPLRFGVAQGNSVKQIHSFDANFFNFISTFKQFCHVSRFKTRDRIVVTCKCWLEGDKLNASFFTHLHKLCHDYQRQCVRKELFQSRAKLVPNCRKLRQEGWMCAEAEWLNTFTHALQNELTMENANETVNLLQDFKKLKRTWWIDDHSIIELT